MLVPQGLGRQAAQVGVNAIQAIGVETDQQQLALWREHALYLAQDLVRIVVKFQAVMCDHCIHTVAFQRQFLGIAKQVDVRPRLGVGVNTVIDWTVLEQRLPAGEPQL